MQLKPDYAPAHHWRGLNLTLMGRFSDADAELRKAQVLDPQSLMITEGLAENFYYWRRYDDVMVQAKHLLQLDPQMPAALILLAQSEVEKGMYAQAGTVIGQFGTEPGMDDAALFNTALISVATGKRDRALHIGARLETTTISRSFLANLYARLNMPDKAFQLLDEAYAQHDPHFAYLQLDPCLDDLRNDQRYRGLVSKLHSDMPDRVQSGRESASR